MTRIMRSLAKLMVVLMVAAPAQVLVAQDAETGPVGPSPYNIVSGWHTPFAGAGYAFGGNSGVFAESPDRIFIAQRGETRLPIPIPSEFAGYAGSLGINTLRATDLRTWQNCLYTIDGAGNVIDVWDQWDYLCAGSEGPGPHRVRISPYDPERRVWVVNETFHQIYVFSNDGSELLMTLGEKNVSGDDETHLGGPQDVAFLPDGRVLVADGLVNSRVIILDADGHYITEFGERGTGRGQFNGVHGLAVGPDGQIYVADRDNHRVQVFNETTRAAVWYHANIAPIGVWPGFGLPLDIIVSGYDAWVTQLAPAEVIKLDLNGNRLYTWALDSEGPGRFLEMHSFAVDTDGNLYGSDNQLGRTQKLVPKTDADPALLIGQPYVASAGAR